MNPATAITTTQQINLRNKQLYNKKGKRFEIKGKKL